ncbi:hypothetical protein J2752_002407 [Halarchaeum rubridurum]|uniref:Uncharacterized protein n=1 Tax=Halarchaeum rubridurum TaxID=489911 RepID=A0A830G2M3_9EURY|nr:hypothetical protein [Halarchaeum rubridurum]MBP1955484.1 hypothetical protein [Halarchaeum rubridurum]GGM72734.1 hypothetical protein GCM10009017_23370 [Halarchaeum rubridurum]
MDDDVADAGGPAERSADTVLVVGRDADRHERTCRSLATDADYRLRALFDETPVVDVNDWYEDGVFAGMTPSQLGIAVSDATSTLASVGETPAYHVCLDAVPPLDGADDERALFRFLHAFLSHVTTDGGRCHLHLDEYGVADTVAPLFDRVVDDRE